MPDAPSSRSPSDWSFPPVVPALPLLPSNAHEPPRPATAAPAEPAAPAVPPVPPVAAEPDDFPTAAVLPVPRRGTGPTAPVSPLRALAGAAVAVAGVLLGIGALLWATDAPDGSPTVHSPSVTAGQTASGVPSPSAVVSTVPSPVLPSPAASPAKAAPVAAPKLPLTVLNNSTRSGLADRAAARFRAGGWPVRLTGNFRGRVEATTVYYAPGQVASAQLLKRSFPGLVRVLPRFPGLPGSGLTVVLTRDFAA